VKIHLGLIITRNNRSVVGFPVTQICDCLVHFTFDLTHDVVKNEVNVEQFSVVLRTRNSDRSLNSGSLDPFVHPGLRCGETNHLSLDKFAETMTEILNGNIETVVSDLHCIENFLSVKVASSAVNNLTEAMHQRGEFKAILGSRNQHPIGGVQSGERCCHVVN
jgi:hypothetical protein